MLEKEIYANGQKVYELKDHYLRYFYKNGALKAEGPLEGNKKSGLWSFYTKDGHMWKQGTYHKGKRHGRWQRFSRDEQVECDCTYEHGQLVK